MWVTIKCGTFLKRWEYQTTSPASWELCMQVKKQQVELDMEQQIGSILGRDYVKGVYCHPAYLTYMQNEWVKSFSRVQLFAIPWTVPNQAPPSMGFSRQEYWSGLPFPSAGGPSRPRDWTRVFCIVGRCFTIWATREVPEYFIYQSTSC